MTGELWIVEAFDHYYPEGGLDDIKAIVGTQREAVRVVLDELNRAESGTRISDGQRVWPMSWITLDVVQMSSVTAMSSLTDRPEREDIHRFSVDRSWRDGFDPAFHIVWPDVEEAQ